MRKYYNLSKMPKFIALMTCLVLSFVSIKAQKVFVVSETGYVYNVKQGKVQNSSFGTRFPHLSKSRPTIIPNPLKFYIHIDDEFDENEWLITYLISINGKPCYSCNAIAKKTFRKHANINHISDDIIEVTIDPKMIPKWDCVIDFAIEYDPNKKHKKSGREQKCWFVKLSQNEYDEELVKWTPSQVEQSIYEIMANQQTTKQLFASIKPKSKTQIPQNGNVQYVIIQDPTAQVQQQTQSVVQQSQPEKKQIESDVDIDIPYSGLKNENAFAVIIANEDYTKVEPVPFAKRDGQRVSDYFARTLGFDKGHITLIENATLNDMRYELNRLSKISDAYNGEISLFVYYCGHGIPDEKNGQGYLLPIDGYGTDVSTAFSIQELYELLGNLKTKQSILFMDACFSGASKNGGMLVAARGVAIKSQKSKPIGNLITFSACQGDETAYPYEEKGHGLMTYYFLKKLQETKGKVTLGELDEYINENVSKTAIVTNGKSQTPSTSVAPGLADTWKNITISE